MNDLLVEEIDSNVESRGHFIAKHGRYVKEYLVSRQEDSARSSHRLNLKDYRDSEIAEYTESSMWNFTQSQWTRQISRWQEGERYDELLSIKTTRTPCTRATEVYLLSLIHGRRRLRFELLKATLIAVRGHRGRYYQKALPIEEQDLNLVEEASNDDV